jgi:hypothetical protein
MHLIRRYATRGVSEIAYDAKRKGGVLVIQRTLEYFGFELERETEVVEEFTPETAGRARKALADAMARGQARHASVKRNRAAIDEIRETYRRSGGLTPRFGLAELTEWYEERLSDVGSMSDFRNARLTLDPDSIVPREERARYESLPQSVVIRDREIDIDYDVEERDGSRTGVARLRLPEKIARNLADSELPELDRPLRFVVIRGQRGAIRADDLDQLQDELRRPWSPDEVEDIQRRGDGESRDERRARELAGHARRGRRDGQRRGGVRRERSGRDGTGRDGGTRRGGGKPGRGKGPRRKFRGR